MLRDAVSCDDRVRLPGDPAPIQLSLWGLAGFIATGVVLGVGLTVVVLL